MKALVAVGSKHGGTEQIGRVVAQQLRADGIETDLVASTDVTDLAGYDAIVIGSAIYVDHVVPPVQALLNRLGEAIRSIPSYLFVSGPLAVQPDAQPPEQVVKMAKKLSSRRVAVFPGRAVEADLRPTERAVLRMKGLHEGDYRDLAEVRDWAHTVAGDLQTRPAGQPEVALRVAGSV